MTVYAVALSKGGSTKTTTAAELVASLARQGRKVLGIDLDQQGNLSTRLGITQATAVDAVAADVLTGDATFQEAANEGNTPHLFFLENTVDASARTVAVSI